MVKGMCVVPLQNMHFLVEQVVSDILEQLKKRNTTFPDIFQTMTEAEGKSVDNVTTALGMTVCMVAPLTGTTLRCGV